MDFYLEFHLQSAIQHSFNDEEYNAIDLFEDEPLPVYATICLEDDDDTSIGSLSGYLLHNETDFYYRCDNISGDCETVAAAVCKKDGSVKNKYISQGNEYDQIFIFDKIEIDKNHRNKGIASTIIKNLPQILCEQFDNAGTTIFLCASDYASADAYGFDSPQYQAGTQKLIEFYKKFGYEIIRENVMGWKE